MDDTNTLTHTSRMSVYQAPVWGSRVARVATISMAGDGTYAVDWMPVQAMRVVGLFTVLTCVDETTHAVLTAFLRLVHHDPRATEGAS